ncbi:MAG: sigma-70 family RNA polymerase sigma factor [Elusimicrobia bacterium]|nr:sigma-70 family RNA polymerase sigma factor [Elusimicrobiota bacterium]
MQRRNVVGYEAFEQWERDLARCKAYGLVGRHGITASEAEDIESELLLHIWVRRKAFNPEHSSKATVETFLKRVVENRIRNILRDRQSARRAIHLRTQSLECPIELKDGARVPVEDLLREEDALEAAPRPEPDTALAIAKAIEALSQAQQELLDLLAQGFSVSDAARTLNRPRTTLNKEIARIRRVFEQEGLRGQT